MLQVAASSLSTRKTFLVYFGFSDSLSDGKRPSSCVGGKRLPLSNHHINICVPHLLIIQRRLRSFHSDLRHATIINLKISATTTILNDYIFKYVF